MTNKAEKMIGAAQRAAQRANRSESSTLRNSSQSAGSKTSSKTVQGTNANLNSSLRNNGNNRVTGTTNRNQNSNDNNNKVTSRPVTGTSNGFGNLNNSNSAISDRVSHSGNSRPGNNGNGNSNGSSVRPGNNGNNGNNSDNGHRPGNGSSVRPGNSGNNNGSSVRPGNDNRPGNGSSVRPGHGWNDNRPGNNSGFRPGNSAPRPGTGSMNRRPLYERPRPIAPRPARHYNNLPVFGPILGINYGCVLNNSLNILLNAGYNIVNTIGDIVYLANVAQYGITWPEAVMYYGPAGLNGACFQYYSPTAGMSQFLHVYNTLVSYYGYPLKDVVSNGIQTATWWGGANTGYITLSYGREYNSYGGYEYRTELVFGNN